MISFSHICGYVPLLGVTRITWEAGMIINRLLIFPHIFLYYMKFCLVLLWHLAKCVQNDC